MPSSLAEKIRVARHRRFVGRADERALFRSTLESAALPFHVLDVHGPGGVGKTALLREFEHISEAAGTPAYYLDARDAEPAPAAFAEAVRRTTALDVHEGGVEATTEARFVLMVDTFEALLPLERWLREVFVPRLPARALLVLAGRPPLPPAWRTDLGLQEIVRPLPLRNLPAAETRRYLEQRGVPKAQREAVLRFAHGHPLALSLVADAFAQQPGLAFEPGAAPDLIETLLTRFLDDVPTPAHRAALEASALVRRTTEALLAHVLGPDGAGHVRGAAHVRALFDWLGGLSFMEMGAGGLLPHELARDVLSASLRWRAPEQHEALLRCARQYYSAQLQRGGARAPEKTLTDFLFLYRENPVVRPFFRQLREKWAGQDVITREAAQDDDWPPMQAMTERHEGAASAELLAYWKERPASSTEVFRDADGELAGFMLRLDLRAVTAADRQRDPCVEAACGYLAEHAPLRGDEGAQLFRFWMSREEHQRVSPVQSLIAAQRVRHYLATPRLAFSFIPCAEPAYWALLFAYADLRRLPEADFEVGGRAFGMFGHDWRVTPPPAWLDLMAERDITPRTAEAVPSATAQPVLVLSEEDFGVAVKEALGGYARPEALHDNPLLRSRLVVERAGRDAAPQERVETLRALLRTAAKSLDAAPREAKYYRALHATYLDPAPTQERAAEALEIPFSTFRRHLRRGIDHVTGVLWRKELGAGTPPNGSAPPEESSHVDAEAPSAGETALDEAASDGAA